MLREWWLARKERLYAYRYLSGYLYALNEISKGTDRIMLEMRVDNPFDYESKNPFDAGIKAALFDTRDRECSKITLHS